MKARLVDFVCTALRFAENGGEHELQRLLDSPYSGVPRSDARAFAVVAAQRAPLLETIVSQRVPLPTAGREAALRFAGGVRRLAALSSLPGLHAEIYVDTIVSAFALSEQDRDGERDLDAIREQARACDESLETCTPATLADRLQRAFARQLRSQRAQAHERRPLLPREREPQRPVRRRARSYSASSLDMFVECRRKWFYRYTCATVDDPGSPASFYGTAFHFALERFHTDVVTVGPDADVAALGAKLTGWINTAFERYRVQFKTNVEFELHRRRAARTAKRYIAWLVRRAQHEPFTVIGNEIEVALELEGLHFIGYIDRIDRSERSGCLHVLDYKTGKIDEEAARYRDRIARFASFQLPFYYWSQTLRGERVTKLVLVPLRDGYGDIEPLELEVVPVPVRSAPRDRSPSGLIGIDELERAKAKMIEIARRIDQERIERFEVAETAQACEYCVYRHACRQRPAPEAPKFSR